MINYCNPYFVHIVNIYSIYILTVVIPFLTFAKQKN